MNSDEVNSPTSPSVSTSTGRRIRVRSIKRPSVSQEVSLPSIPSDDNDWVSPFTLPPLPAFKKNRSQVDRSPEDRIHNRSGSSAYYAAAWGSPYATPSPNQSPAPRLHRNKSLDLESSPLATRKSVADQSPTRHTRQQSLPTHDSIKPPVQHTSPSPTDPIAKSQRRNWLSESEGSGSEADKASGQTPRQRRLGAQESAPSSVRSHHVQESVDTITPETFNGASGITEPSGTQNTSPRMDVPMPTASPAEEKPLPSLPKDTTAHDAQVGAQSRPYPPLPAQPFQRPKKKVPWKGKSCMIAMPLTDREQAGLPPALSSQEKQDLLQKWIDLGYPIHGFSVGDWNSSFLGAGGASRPAYPDPTDLATERNENQASVHIPNQAEWEAWVSYLKEEKLRALGVTPSASEAPPSTRSPFSSAMSRLSSAYPSNAASPPVPPMSVASTRAQMSNSSFSPALSNQGSVSFPFPQRATPGLPNGRPMHGYTQSVAFPGMGQRINSPFEHSMSPSGVYGNVRSPAEQINGRRPWTPGHVQNMQSMANILSPVNPSPQDFPRGYFSNPQVHAIQRQQEALARQQQDIQARIANHHRQMSMFPLRAMSNEQVQQFPRTPKATSPEREPPEIMHPTPRSHRHNLSAALEKGLPDSVAASTKDLSEIVNGDKKDVETADTQATELEEGEIPDEAEQEELPILHRPETIKDIDDKAEIETNPSIAGTPLLLDDKNPFANFKPLPPPEPTNKRPGFGHSAQPSLSKLNVQAKEFSPSKATFSPNAGVFNFDGDAFASHSSSPGKSVASGPRFGHKHNPSSLGLNVAAAVFTPSFVPKSADKGHSSASNAVLGSARMSREVSQEGTTTDSEHNPQVPPLSFAPSSIPEEPSLENPTFNPEASPFSFEAMNSSQTATQAKSPFDPRSSTFSFTSGDKSQGVTPAQSGFDPRSSTLSTFSFDSTGFNVEAPEFKPSGISLNSVPVASETPSSLTSTGSIFGDVNIDSTNKPERRNKALPIVRPQSRGGSAVQEEADQVDEAGRPLAPSDRHKRAKITGLENEDVLFADSAPFKSLSEEAATDENDGGAEGNAETTEPAEEPTARSEETAILDATTESPQQSHVNEEVLEPDARIEPVNDATKAPKSLEEPAPQTEIAQPVQGLGQAEEASEDTGNKTAKELTDSTTEKSLVEADIPATESTKPIAEDVTPNAAEENSIDLQTEEATQDHTTSVDTQMAGADKAATPGLSAEAPVFKPTLTAQAPAFEPSNFVAEKPQAGLSATAAPFEFRPAARDHTADPVPKPATPPAKEAVPKPKKGGLMASKFAAPLSPEPESPKMVERNSSPPQQLFGEQEIEAPTEEMLPIREEPADSVSDLSEPVNLHQYAEPAAEDKLWTLEKYREHDSQSPSVVSQAGDLTYEEINAVMKQFEDDPDLGVIRVDTPVKSTPLVDIKYPQQFRSDAPSPSPNRRLDRPFDPDQERSYGGLGFDISGVHQLNYGGSGEISDWNADLSPGQQDKLESRAKFFDDHVNDLVDNVLESRLAPLERVLQKIQNSMQQASVKSNRSRRSMSTERQESDADDEDNYDAYEGYAHYRSKSPIKRDRRQEKIKAAVLEAMTVAQSAAAAPQLDMSSIQDALGEMRELAQTVAAQQQPPVDVASIQETLAELKSFTQREPTVPKVDTSELTRAIAEINSIAQQRSSEPQLDIQAMQATLNEIRQIASEKPVIPEVDLSIMERTLAELKAQAQEKAREQPSELKTVLEDVISSHPRLRGSRVEAEHDSTKKLQVKINDLEAMLKVAEKRADGEAALRREAEEENDTLMRHLKDAQDQAALHKESSEEAQKSLASFLQEKHEYRGINNELRDLRDKNEALEKTLDEYRIYRQQMKDELESERSRTDSIARALQDARQQHRDQLESRDVLREQLNRIQERMTKVMEDVRHDESEFRKREHDLLSKNQLLQAALDHETNRRARMELDAEKLNREHRESLHFRSKHETAQEEVSRLAAIIVTLQTEHKNLQDTAYAAQRELVFLKERQEDIIGSQVGRLQDELERSKSMFQNLQSDSDARVARLQGQLDATSVELQEAKARHESNMEKMFENHNTAIRHAKESHATELEQRLAVHEDRLTDLRNQHIRDMHNAADDRKALEHRYEAKLELSDDKNKHLESKVKDLEHLLDITKTAARAAADSAVSKSINLPTPANSVIASPPHRPSVSSASVPLQKGSDLPEKISPQALRETILVLQDQLQNREQKIDKLEAELAVIDKEAPNKVKERDTEIVMLRELLDVRIEDLQELIATLEKPEYNRTAVKDAAIRLKTQIKMDQQLRERTINGASLANNLPSSITSGISNLTQSPRAMVAAAAWGNWRKIRDSGVGSAVSDFASNIGSQTPTRSTSSPNPLAGIMTPPVTSKSSSDSSSKSTARPLAAAAAARKAGPPTPSSGARPLRSFSTQPRALGGARPLARRGTNESTGSVIHQPSSMKVEPPSTPLQLNADSDFADDVDDDASPLDGKDRGFGLDDAEELVAPKPVSRRASRSSVSKSISPRVVRASRSSRSSRLSAGKPVSPRALRASAGVAKDEVVEVFEEN